MSRYRPEPSGTPDGDFGRPPWGVSHWQPSYQNPPQQGQMLPQGVPYWPPQPSGQTIDPTTGQPVMIDPTTGQPVPQGSSPATTAPATGFDLGSIFGSLQTTTVLGIPLLYIIIAGVAYFVFIKKR